MRGMEAFEIGFLLGGLFGIVYMAAGLLIRGAVEDLRNLRK